MVFRVSFISVRYISSGANSSLRKKIWFPKEWKVHNKSLKAALYTPTSPTNYK